MIDLDAHYVAGVRRFLQTAIVIDDQAEFAPVTRPITSVLIAPPTGSLVKRATEAAAAKTHAAEPANDVVAAKGAEAAVEAQRPESVERPPGDEEQPPAAAAPPEENDPVGQVGLNAKVLSEAFLGKNMICGLYRPAAGDNMVESTTGAARQADIVVVDWHLEEGSSRAAKDIILSLLKADAEENGRLRLVAVYTSQPGLTDMAADLLKEVEEQPSLKGRLRADGPALVGGDTRIIFLNKRGSAPSNDRDEVLEADLPERLVGEFAKLSDGLLATFAISAVAAVRRGAHHVLALYTEDLDGAYVAHRSALPHPDDAISFAADLIASELKNLIELDDTADRNLKADVVDAWLARLADGGHTFRTDRAEIPAAEVKKFIAGGSEAVKNSENLHHAHGNAANKASKANRVSCGALPRIFYTDAASAMHATRLLARLATFQRERIGRARLPEHWRPTLTLGSVLQALPSGETPELLLCMQPRCDSVRLKKAFPFPFQTIDSAGANFNIALRDVGGEAREAWVNLKPRDSKMLTFMPEEGTRTVRAVLEDGLLVFTDDGGRKYAWLGDVKEMKAQKWAGDLGGRVLGVALDDFEWLRIASERQIVKDWT
jgi:hypothetical protein